MRRNDRQDYLDTSTNYATGINDLQFEKNAKQQKAKEKQEQYTLERVEKKEELKRKINEYKSNTVPIYKVKKIFLITTIACAIIALIALFNGFLLEGAFTALAAGMTIVIAQNIRLGNTQPKLTNVIMFNLSKSIKDFIDYKIPYELYDSAETWLDMYTILGMFAFAFLPSDNIFYGLVLVLLTLVLILTFAVRNMENFHNHVKLLAPACFVGLIVKLIFQYIYMGVIDVDLTNVVLINVFSIISAYTEELRITKPQ